MSSPQLLQSIALLYYTTMHSLETALALSTVTTVALPALLTQHLDRGLDVQVLGGHICTIYLCSKANNQPEGPEAFVHSSGWR